MNKFLTFLISIAIFFALGNGQQDNSTEPTCDLISPFRCTTTSECTDRFNFCDGISDCSDGSDEVLYNATIHDGQPGTVCRLNRGGRRECFISEQYICDDELDCFFGSDECNCNNTFHCVNEFFGLPVCRLRIQFCDNVVDCPDRSDESPYSPDIPGYQCAVTKTSVTSYCLLPEVHTCDGTIDCDDGTDECLCESVDRENGGTVLTTVSSNARCFRCLNSELVVPQRQTCDGIFHCNDLTDECLCPTTNQIPRPPLCDQICLFGQDCNMCEVGQIMCRRPDPQSPQICIDTSAVCDRIYDCPLQEDETNCRINPSQIFFCSDGQSYVNSFERCNNEIDCEDGSDEENCTQLYECIQFQQNPNTGVYDFANPRFAIACNDIPECQDLDDECNSTICGDDLPAYCDLVQGLSGFICPNSLSAIIGKEICDGFPTCFDTMPQLSQDEWNCTGSHNSPLPKFYCSDMGATSLPIHIPLDEQCNSITDCYDGSDEVGCSTDVNFYCAGGDPFYIPQDRVCNGIQDCEGGEDECQDCAVSPFSSDRFLINSFVLQVFVWIMAILATIGNIAVLIDNVLFLKKNYDTIAKVGLVNRILVINLAVADLLLGIYLLSIASVNSNLENVYCNQDIQWRSSNTCIGLGCLVVTCVEASVFILAIMTTHRLLIVLRPLKHNIKTWRFNVSIFLSWVVALTLALVPLSSSQIDYFLSGVWYRNNRYLTTASRVEVENFVIRFLSEDGTNKTGLPSALPERVLTWDGLFSTFSELNPDYIPGLYFGYYSADGVCLPRIFPNPATDRSWGYSLFLIIINFISFMYMFAAYAIIIYLTNKRARKAGRQSRSSNNLQSKVTRIVLTNFLCWFPICTMAFISVSGITLSQQAYAVSAIILLPINSATNPFLYSSFLDVIWGKVKASPLGVKVMMCCSMKEKEDTELRTGQSLPSGITNVHTQRQSQVPTSNIVSSTTT